MTIEDRILLPLASITDAQRTVEALIAVYADADYRPLVIPMHIIEKGDGSIDRLPVNAQKGQAAELFTYAIEELEAAGFEVAPALFYGSNVVDTIIEAATDDGASAIVFLPREGGRLSRFLTGDRPTRLIMESPIPVITLPQPTAQSD